MADIKSYLQLAAISGKLINDDTAVGKAGKAAKWSTVAVLILAILTAITGNPALFAWHSGALVVLANVLIVFLKNLTDPNVPNI